MKVITNIMKTNLKSRSRIWIKGISVLCVISLIICTLLGCTSADQSKEIDELRSELTKEINSLKAANTAAQTELDTLKESYAAAKAEIDSLKVAKESAEQKLNTLRASYDSVLKKTNDLKATYESESRDFKSLKESYDTAVSELESLKSDLEQAESELDSLQSGYDEAMLEIERLREQVRAFEEIITLPKIKIYIDQGHNPTGNHNAGAAGNGLYEQDITFNVGLLLAELLNNDGRFEICLSRPTADTVLGSDNPTSLEARVRGAEEFGADFFISIHTNSFENDTAYGTEVHVATENSISYSFGNALLDGMIASTNMRNRGMKISPNLHVLKNTTMPAALLEMGFISNPDDAAMLSGSPELFAQGIYNGILSYFELDAES